MKRRKSARHPRGERGEPEQVLHAPGPLAPGAHLTITGDEADHALRSLRLRTDDPVHVVDGAGFRAAGRVTRPGKGELDVVLDTVEVLPVWPARAVHVAAGVLRGPRMDTLVEKISELGATSFRPLLLERCVARPSEGGAKLERWRRIAVESLKQSKRARLLEVEEPVDLVGFLEALPAGAHLRVADPEGGDPRTPPAGEGPVVLVSGPEGGLAPRELEALDARGAERVALGGNRLRAETAAFTLLAVTLAGLGEFTRGYRANRAND